MDDRRDGRQAAGFAGVRGDRRLYAPDRHRGGDGKALPEGPPTAQGAQTPPEPAPAQTAAASRGRPALQGDEAGDDLRSGEGKTPDAGHASRGGQSRPDVTADA